MRYLHFILSGFVVSLAAFAMGAEGNAPERKLPSASQVQAAIKAGELINGMTFKQATVAMKPAKPDVTRSDGKIVSAVWLVPSQSSDYARQWSADVDPDMTIWNVKQQTVRQEAKNNPRADRIRRVRERQRGN